MVEMKKMSDAVERVSNTNKDLVVRKCALEAQNKQKDYKLGEMEDKLK